MIAGNKDVVPSSDHRFGSSILTSFLRQSVLGQDMGCAPATGDPQARAVQAKINFDGWHQESHLAQKAESNIQIIKILIPLPNLGGARFTSETQMTPEDLGLG